MKEFRFDKYLSCKDCGQKYFYGEAKECFICGCKKLKVKDDIFITLKKKGK